MKIEFYEKVNFMKNILNFLTFFILFFAAVFAPVFGEEIKQNKIKADLTIANNEIFIISLFDREINKDILSTDDESEQRKIDELYNADLANRALGNVVLVKNPNFNLLINTGDRSVFNRLKAELEKRDTKIADITHIALCNAYSDNIGGLGKIYKKFKNATLLMDKNEYNYWQKEGDELSKKRLEFYKNKLEFFENGAEIIKNSGIKPIDAKGNTPGSVIFSFNDEFFDICDLIYSFDIQLLNPNIGSKYDIDATKANESRNQIITLLKENKKKFIGFYAPESEALSFDEWLEIIAR